MNRYAIGIDVGGTTADGEFSLEVARCFGACGLAPTIMIDEDVHQRVKPLKLRAILEQYANGKGPAKKAAPKPAVKKAAGGPGGKGKRTVARKPAKRTAGRTPAKRAAVKRGAGR